MSNWEQKGDGFKRMGERLVAAGGPMIGDYVPSRACKQNTLAESELHQGV